MTENYHLSRNTDRRMVWHVWLLWRWWLYSVLTLNNNNNTFSFLQPSRLWNQSMWTVNASSTDSANAFHQFPAIQEKPHSCKGVYLCWFKFSIWSLLCFFPCRDSDGRLTLEAVLTLFFGNFTNEGTNKNKIIIKELLVGGWRREI